MGFENPIVDPLSCRFGIFRVGPDPARKSPLFGRIINTSLTKLVRSRWLDIGFALFSVFIDLNIFSVPKDAENKLANIRLSRLYLDLSLGQ